MTYNYRISEATQIHLGLYQLCFSQKEFCEGYGICISQTELQSIINAIALTPYRDVRRYILFYKGKPISFCHFQFQENIVKASGGILPALLNSGKGLIAAAIFYDFYFKSFPTSELEVEIKKENVRNLRMHKALGFVECFREEKVTLKITSKEFPNKFTIQLLSKINYEIN